MDGDSCGKLLTCLNQKLLKLDYVCESVDESHHYSSSRMIMILAEFEREFSINYIIRMLKNYQIKMHSL